MRDPSPGTILRREGYEILRPCSDPVSVGVVVTAMSQLLYKQGGELVLWPGIFIEVMVNGLLLFVSSSDNFYSLPSGTNLLLNAVFYATVVFLIYLQ